jgi:hypothetical protein
VSPGKYRMIAREMQRVALRYPLSLAAPASDTRFFRAVSREVTWGLTLNK